MQLARQDNFVPALSWPRVRGSGAHSAHCSNGTGWDQSRRHGARLPVIISTLLLQPTDIHLPSVEETQALLQECAESL